MHNQSLYYLVIGAGPALISINKVYNGPIDPELKLRMDWNSLPRTWRTSGAIHSFTTPRWSSSSTGSWLCHPSVRGGDAMMLTGQDFEAAAHAGPCSAPGSEGIS